MTESENQLKASEGPQPQPQRPRRFWFVLVAASALLVVILVITVTVISAANNAAAERAAAEAAAEQVAVERAEATELASERKNADSALGRGELFYEESEVWGDAAARATLRSALDALAAARGDAAASAEDLESAISTVARAKLVVGSPPAPVELICGNLDEGVDYSVHTVNLNRDGSGQFDDVWAAHLGCDAGMDGGVKESVPVQTPLQAAAVAAAKEAGYDGVNDEILYSVYDGCAASGSGSYYSDSTSVSEAQSKEIRAYLTLCPDHPDAQRWRVAIGEGQQDRGAEANGARIPPGGTYEVPSQMARGTFTAENVKNCYWETRNANGDIVENNFVIAAPRVVAEITAEAVVFTTEGGCGYWNRQ